MKMIKIALSVFCETTVRFRNRSSDQCINCFLSRLALQICVMVVMYLEKAKAECH